MRKRLLYIDTPKILSNLINFAALSVNGFETTHISNGYRAIEKIDANTHNGIIFANLRIPSIKGAEDYSLEHGLEVIKYAAEKNHRPIILLEESLEKYLEKEALMRAKGIADKVISYRGRGSTVNLILTLNELFRVLPK